MDKNQIAMQELQKGVDNAIKQAINNAPFDKTEIGKIVYVNSTDGTYNVELNKITYENIDTLNKMSFIINDMVKIMIPQNNYNNMFIYGKI